MAQNFTKESVMPNRKISLILTHLVLFLHTQICEDSRKVSYLRGKLSIQQDCKDKELINKEHKLRGYKNRWETLSIKKH